MGKKKMEPDWEQETAVEEETVMEPETAGAAEPLETPEKDGPPDPSETAETGEPKAEVDPVEALQASLAAEEDKYLRLLAEYDNFRKRSQKEKEDLYTCIRAETVEKFLPVYDNLERALNVPTADEAYRKGVEMTMTGLCEVLEKLGVEIFGEAGETFDPNMHNAVMHCEDDSLGENVVAEIFQRGFRVGGKVVRFAMVRVAN